MIDQELLRELTESYLKSVVSDASDSLSPEFDSFAAFGELGINSFQILKIIKKLEGDFGTLPKSLLFENFDINDLTGYFVDKHEKALVARFAAGSAVSVVHTGHRQPQPIAAPREVERRADPADVLAPERAPIHIPEKDAYTHPELKQLVQTLFTRYKTEGGVSRGTRKIAPNLFIGGARRGYFNYGRSKDIVVVYSYTGPRDYVHVLLEEMYRYCATKSLQLNIIADEQTPPICGTSFSATPFGVLQRIVKLKEFTLDGGAMRRLRYQVSKFQKSGTCRTEEYRCGSSPETDQKIAGVIDRWCESRTVVNPLVHDVRAEILAGALNSEHRLFLTYLDDVLQNVILITAMCAEENGHLMDLEFYLPDMPLGGLEFAIAQIIEVLVREGCDVLSLGGTYGCKLEPSASADPEIDKILDELRAQNIFNDEGNLQFKSKFRPESKPIFLCRAVGSGNPDNVIDIIMMIADPLKMQTSDEEDRAFSAPRPDVAMVVEEPAARRSTPSEPTQGRSSVRSAADGDERLRILSDCGFNPLNIQHEYVDFDLKTDSWSQLEMPAIQAQMRRLHGQLQQPVNVDDSLRAVFPFAHFVLTPSGQAAEHAFFKAWPNKGVIPQNLLFPSTIFHQIDKGFTPRELPHPAVFQLNSEELYKGNMAWEVLELLVTQDPAAIPFVCIEVSNNAAGGTPVSLQHLRSVKALLAEHSISLVLDATRVVENAQFVIEQEEEFAGRSIWAVVREILSCADAVIGSLTKDFCVNKGGIIATNDVKLFHQLQELVQEEGGEIDLIDRKLIALSLQNRKHIEANVLRRMEAVRLVWRALKEHNVPVVHPAGGHCILIDVRQIPEFKNLSDPVASFLAWMYVSTGIRAGAHSVGMQKHTTMNDLVRLAIPVGMKRDQIDSVIDRLVHAFAMKANIPEVFMESSAPQPLGGVYAKYQLLQYRNGSQRIVAKADDTNDARSLPASPPPAPGPPSSDTATVGHVFEQDESVPVGVNTKLRRPGDVAIVGMAGRYPKAKNLGELWANLAEGRDCIEQIPADRYERRVQHGSTTKYRGGFIDEVDRFDSLFFNISPREAEILDPQERLFLEVAWEAIEDAGYYPEILAQGDTSRNIGVFVGAVWAMYQMLGVEEKHLGNKNITHSFLWSIANRVSYALNLSGPSLTLDTACSSSLTALYLACEAIQSGGCSAAIVGGVNLDLHQAKFDINYQGGALSADGVCRTFGKGANGYVMGEGVGALFLKPLDQAVKDGDNIYGVIKSAVVNHGGRTSGYTVPNPRAQAALISAALKKANIDARSIGYVEAHGTGTELGDPIEITGLSDAFQSYTVENQSCAIGSIKTNIGHLEPAAGIVGVSKVLLQMKHRQLVPSLHASELNEFIDFEHSPFYVVQNLEEWKAKEVDGVRLPLRAGISSFGAGGSNAHIILENYEPVQQASAEPTRTHQLIFPLSARNDLQLREAAVRLAKFLQQNDVDLNDTAYTLQQGRKSFEHRLAVIAVTKEEVIETLTCFIDGKRNQDIVTGLAKGGEGLTRLLNRREKQEFIRLVSQRANPHKIAGLWAEGLLADWQRSQPQGAGKRISLPTYPFADKRHWSSGPSTVSPAFQPAAALHPMVDTNESTFERQLFKKTFHERDFFIYDHHVSDTPTLPGVAYLELARKAGEIAAGRKVQRIKNILWISPIALQNSTPKEVFIELKPSGDSVQFEVFSEDAEGNKTPHSQGKLLYATDQETAAEPEYIDLESVRARCAKVTDGKTAYPLFKSFGLDLGPSFQVLYDVYKNEHETLGALKLPESREGDLQTMVLHPSLVDGSLQAGMAAQIIGPAGEMLVPFSIGEVEILQPLQPNCFSYVTRAKEDDARRGKSSVVVKSNVLIVDEAGKILVKIRDSVGVPLRQVHKHPMPGADVEGSSRLYYSYDWLKAPLAAEKARQNGPRSLLLFDTDEIVRELYRARLREAGTIDDQVVLVRPGETFEDTGNQSYTVNPRSKADFTRLFDSLIERGCPVENICFAWPLGQVDFLGEKWLKGSLERGVYAFLFVCQSLTELKLENKAQLLYLYSSSKDDAQPHNEAVGGFVNTLRVEHPRLLCKTLEIRQESAGREEILDALSAELQARTHDANVVRYAAGERFVRKLKAFDLHEAPGAPPFEAVGIKENGVYLITGGAGGLGLIFAEFLAKEHKARMVLTGRSPLSAEQEARLEDLRKAGAEVLYIPADVSNDEDARKLIGEAKARFGAINGIIHAAGVLRDSLIRNKTPEEMSAVFAPKVYGTLHLDELTKDEDLDFFVMFSSLAAVTGNGGQCDYSFANYFMDSFATERERRRADGVRSGKTLSLNWSIWADGGMKLDEQTELLFKRALGISPVRAATGLDAFVRGLASGRSQFAVLEGIQERIELAWGLRKKDTPPAAPPSLPAADQAVSAAIPDGGDGDLLVSLQNDLSQIVMGLLKLDAGDVSHDKILLDLGFDSIGLTTYANVVNEKYQLDITPVLFFDYPTIEEIAKYLCADRKDEILRFYRGSSSPATTATPPPAAQQHAQTAAPERHQAATLEFRRAWKPTALDREATPLSSGIGFSPALRFVNEPIAIVGMSGVMPQSEDLDEFWENLKTSTDMITVIPEDRWKWEDYYGDPLKEVNKTNSRWGGFMKEVDKFDPLFFGISPREAQMMDPQQRIFLETVWKAIEDSGQKVSDLSGTKTGLFVGVATNDYIEVLRDRHAALDGYSASGNSHSVLANRVSFLLNLHGPSAPIDTACSSSLVALHRAIESIHTRSCDMAIVGGVQVNLSPGAFISFGAAGMLSPDGKCKTFDKRANGYVRGEGSGAIFIKRLSAAEADGNHIYAIIKATAENHGGKVTTLTAPNSAAQSELLIEAYEKAQVDPATVGYIECHGTGTSLGDPIEIQALSRAFSELYKKRDKAPALAPHCGLSSVKTNIGHLETAAGIAGILKTLLAIKHKQIPANIHFEEINPYINLKGTPFYIADKLTPWKSPIGEDGLPAPRRAGVSSFGFGGANAHIVLEEYIPARSQSPSAAHEPQLIVLSAKNENRLTAYVRSMLAYLDKREIDLADFAYTLQVGRDEMPERLAFVASSAEDLKRKFEAILSGRGDAPKDSYRNTVRKKDSKSQTADVALGEPAIQALIGRKELSKLAEIWASGAKIDWRLLYKSGAPRRISAPTYPFARERYWVPAAEEKTTRQGGDPAPVFLHPLIHRNTSTLEEQRFSSRFSGEEFYLADHVVETHKILPGVAYLEMARAAGELSGNAKVRVIRNLTWERPLVVESDGKEVEISLAPFQNEVKFVVRTGAGESAMTHCTGRLAYQADVSGPEVLDIAGIRARCSEQVMAGKDLYPVLSRAGLKLGRSFQIVQSIYATDSESLAILQLPEHLKEEAGRFWLHPALMDGSLHTAVGLAMKGSLDVSLGLPYSVGEVQIFHPLQDLHYGYATWADDPKAKNMRKVNFLLLDKNGKVLVRLKDFVARPLQPPSTTRTNQQATAPGPNVAKEEVTPGLQSLLPVWNRVHIESSTPGALPESGNLLLLGSDQTQLDWVRTSYPSARLLDLASTSSADVIEKKLGDCSFDQLLWMAPDVRPHDGGESAASERIIEQQEKGVLAVFRIIKALLHLGYANKKLQWTLVIRRTQRVTEGEPIQPAHAGIAGLVGSLAKEYPQWDLRLLDIDSLASVLARECLSLPWDKQGDILAHRQREWFRQGLALMTALPQASAAYRQNGVYVVIGGAGGVGEVWSRFMIENYQANIVWIGRRERNATIEGKINSLAQFGPAPVYVSADATNAVALEQACKAILEAYPVIHGVVHSAIVLQDQSIVRMDEPAFRASLSAKVDVSVNMDRAFGSQELDFMLFFSSIVSFVKAPGQSNYSAGCTFKDSFAHELQQRRSYPVKIVNWGYWGNVGVVADESHNKTMAQMGIGSIEPAEGMALLQVLVGSEMHQLALIKTLNSQATAGLNLAETVTQYPQTAPAILPRVERVIGERASGKSIAALEAEMPTAEMTDFVTEILASSLMSLGLFKDGIATLAALSMDDQPAPYYERWLSSSIRYLQQQKVLAEDLMLGGEVRPLSDLWAEWETKQTVWTSVPNLHAQVALLETCLRALPGILTARQLATDVIFPNSSMQLVEGIYRGNVVADHFNDVLAEVLVACIEQQLQADKQRGIRILEIGAGTGGTTAKLLTKLQRFPIAEYCYTDVSRAFLMYAEKTFKSQLPTLTTAIFDVTKPLVAQSIPADHYDFAIAANVLHATPDIRQALRNTKAALKNHGVLLLNEIATWSVFNHLTFGLLEGWWLHEDTAVRLPGSPGLAPAKWREILAAEGFEAILFPAVQTHQFGQQIVAAGSNGWTRQRIVKQVTLPLSAGVEHTNSQAADVEAAKNNRTPIAPSPSAELDGQRSAEYVRRIITEKLSEALRLDAILIGNDAPFADYGVDSIIGVNLVRTISEALQIELETTSLFEYSSVDQLSEYIHQKWREQIDAQLGPVQSSVPTVTDSGHESRAEADTRSAQRFITNERFADARDGFGSAETDSRNVGVEPIAIIGMSGRFAESESLDAFWQNLAEGKDLTREVSRWSTTDCVMSESSGRAYCSHGSFVDSIDRFDPAFFGISADEAVYMDPQQRLFLEEAWKALEDAGYAGKDVHEKQCGVYVGCGSSYYDRLAVEEPPPQAFWGNSQAIIPARIAYYLDLQGPAIAVDTACSSSLVTIHLACQGLWSRETDMALAGGVFLQATPGFYQVANRAGMLSPDGKCYSFDARANGFVPGEGVGVIVLKRLRDALQDGDYIHGVIAGSGINQDGKSNGLIAPNGRAQERLERSVYDRFKINPETIQVIEAHATGTLMGDSLEFAALSRSFREYTDKKQFCALGTVKTNIGHAATAAGVASVLKLLLSLKHRQIPPSLHFEKGNPAIDFESGPFYVNTQLREWKVKGDETRRAAISSFGFSGTNAHLVIEQAPSSERTTLPLPGYLVMLSARTAEQLKQQVHNLLALVKRTPDLSMNDLSFSLFVGRMHLTHRVSCVARNQKELIQLLERWVATGSANQIYTSEARDGTHRENGVLKKFGNYCIQECLNATNDDSYLENLAATADLYVQGYALEYCKLFSSDSRRIPLPTYPFARERYWIETVGAAPPGSRTSSTVQLHPLLHANTSTLSQQSYSSTLTGSEFFLRDHQFFTNGQDGRKVMPEAAYLEMARAAMERAEPGHRGSSVVELANMVWGDPLVVAGNTQVTIALFAGEDERINYEIYSGEHEQETVHCQGRASFSKRAVPAPFDMDALRAQMREGELEPEAVYLEFAKVGVHYGPTHRAIRAVHRGDRQLLARLALPRSLATSEADGCHGGYLLHPSVVSGAMQAGLLLMTDQTQGVRRPLSQQGLERLCILSPCTEEMFAWARYAQGRVPADGLTRLDIDIIDIDGNVCVQMRGLALREDDEPIETHLPPEWLFSTEMPSGVGEDAAHNVPMGPEEKVTLLLRQEAAIQLQRPIDEIPTDRSYFDLGLSSLAITKLVQDANRLLGENLSPSVLFEYADIQSLATFLATTYPAKIDAIMAIRRIGLPAHLGEPRYGHRPRLTRLLRKKYFGAGPTRALDEQTSVIATEAAMGSARVLEDVLWQELMLSDSYEKLTF
jgi:polyketide synthase PksN